MTPSSWLLLAALPLSARAQQGAPAPSTHDIEAKVALESAVEKRLEAVLRRMLGTQDVVAIANAQLVGEADRAEIEVMPGVTVKETPAAPAPLELPSSLVRRLTVTIFVDEALPPAEIALAQKTAERLVALQPQRGDALAIERMSFHRLPTLAAAPMVWRLVSVNRLLSLAWLLLALYGLVLLYRRFVDPLLALLREASQSLRASAPRREFQPQAEASGEPAAAAPPAAALPSSNGAGSRKPPFHFLLDRDLPALRLLLGQMADSDAATIIHYLPAATASQALTALPPQRRQQVIAHMSHAVLLEPAQVKALEDSILSKIDYILGGEDKLSEILEQATIPVQQEILALIRQRDAQLCQRLEKRIVVLDDLARLDESGLAVLSRQVPVRSLAAALKSSPALQEKILPRLRSGLGEWLAQEIELSGDLPEQVKEQEARRVLRTLAQLTREGKISLARGEPPSANGSGSPSSNGGPSGGPS